jgi:hypothetical protein
LETSIRSSKSKSNSLNSLPETRESRVASIETKARSNTNYVQGSTTSNHQQHELNNSCGDSGSYHDSYNGGYSEYGGGSSSSKSTTKRRSISDTTEIQSKVQQELLRQKQEQLLLAKSGQSSNSNAYPEGYTKNRSQTQYQNNNNNNNSGGVRGNSPHRHDRIPHGASFISSTTTTTSQSVPRGRSPVRPLGGPVSPIIVNTKGSASSGRGGGGGGGYLGRNGVNSASLPRQRPNRLSFYVDPFYVGSIQVI